MKTINQLLIIIFLSNVFLTTIIAQTSSSRIAILPFRSNGIDQVSVGTAESILRTEIGKLSSMDIVSQKRVSDALAGSTCSESDCAVGVGKKLDAAQVFGCRLSALGEKIIVQYFLVNVSSGKEELVDQGTALNVEDLDVLMKRVAKSVVDLEPMAKSVEVGNILPVEAEEPLRRSSRNNFGISFGYLYPQNGYDNSDRIFVLDMRFDHEIEDYAIGLNIGTRKGFAATLYGSYLLSREDFCPYIGVATGFHWVSHGSLINIGPNPQQDLRGDGLSLIGHAGIRVFHTYDFQLIFNLEYVYTMNDYDDRAIVFTIGIL